jgi:hypothetical protein
MGLFRVRFTIRSLLKVTACCAALLAVLRTPMAPFVLIMLFIVAGFVIDRTRGGSGIAGAALFGGLASFGTGIVACASVHFLGDPTVFTVGGLGLFFFSLVVAGALLGALLGTVLWLAVTRIGQFSRPALSDSSCGPIERNRPRSGSRHRTVSRE